MIRSYAAQFGEKLKFLSLQPGKRDFHHTASADKSDSLQQDRGYFGICIRDLCKTPLFAQFPCHTQILILKILNVFLWLRFSRSLNLNKNEHFSNVSITALRAVVPHFRFKKVLILYLNSSRAACRGATEIPSFGAAQDEFK
jgi:hypothetical protein